MKLLIPLVLALAGLAGGLAAGHLLRPSSEPPEHVAGDGEAAETEKEAAPAPPKEKKNGEGAAARAYVELERQFVVPLAEAERITGLMIITLSLETDPGLSGEIHARAPKLRDRFLRVLFLHAQSGGFDGVFTAGPRMQDLRGALLEAAREVLGPVVHDVLVTDILRQDV